MNKEARVFIRLSEDEKAGFEKAAEIAGLGLSTWARQILKAAAVKQHREAGMKITFLKFVNEVKPKIHGRKTKDKSK